MKAKADEAAKAEADAATEEAKEGDAAKKQQKKKKGKEIPTAIAFGKGTRALFDFLKVLDMESGNDIEVFRKKLDVTRNLEL